MKTEIHRLPNGEVIIQQGQLSVSIAPDEMHYVIDTLKLMYKNTLAEENVRQIDAQRGTTC